MDKILNKIQNTGILPVAALDDVRNAFPLAQALCAGNIFCIEVLSGTKAAEESIAKIADGFPQMLVGAGDIRTVQEASRAVNAGAKFIITPEFSPSVITYCIDRAIPVIPGVSSSDELETAISLGLHAVNLFPAGQDMERLTIQASQSSHNHINFIPAECINENNVSAYPFSDHVLTCKWNMEPKLIQAGEFGKIRDQASTIIRTMLGFEFAHIGINLSTKTEADKTAGMFDAMFGFQKKPGTDSIFAGASIECMTPPCFGTKGHIAIATNSIVSAKSYFESAGYKFNEASAKFINQKMIVIYFEEEVGGFAVHLLQR